MADLELTSDIDAFLGAADNAAARTALGVPAGSGTSTGTNTGDQTSIVGITGTKAQFDAAASDGNFFWIGGAGGTPSSLTLTNATGLPVTGIAATGSSISTKFLRGDGTWQTVSGGGGESADINGYIGPVTLTGPSASWAFTDGSQAYLEQEGDITVTITAIPDGHSGSLAILVVEPGEVTFAFTGLTAKTVDNFHTLEPETLPPNSWLEYSFKRTGDVVRLFGSKRTALSVPTTEDTPVIAFNGSNKPYVAVSPAWTSATATGHRWLVNDVHDSGADDDNPYLGTLTDLDTVKAVFVASNADNSAEVESNEIIFDADAEVGGGLLDGLLAWWENAGVADVHNGHTVEGTAPATVSAPNGLLAWRTTEYNSATLSAPLVLQSNQMSSTATLAWAGRISGSVNDFSTIARFANTPELSLVGITWTGDDGRDLRVRNVYDTLALDDSIAFNQWTTVVVSMNGGVWTVYIDGVAVGTSTSVYGTGELALDRLFRGGATSANVDHAVVACASRAWTEEDALAFHNEGNLRAYSSI